MRSGELLIRFIRFLLYELFEFSSIDMKTALLKLSHLILIDMILLMMKTNEWNC